MQARHPLKDFIKELTHISIMANLGMDSIPTVQNQMITRDLGPRLNKAILELLKHFNENAPLMIDIRCHNTLIQADTTLESIKLNVDMMRKAASALLRRDFHNITLSARLMAQLCHAGSKDNRISPSPADIAPMISQYTNEVYSDVVSTQLAFDYSKRVAQHNISGHPAFKELEAYLAENMKHNSDNDIKNLEHFLAVLRNAPTDRALKEAVYIHEPLANITLDAFKNSIPKEEGKKEGWFSSFTSFFHQKKVEEDKKPADPHVLLTNLVGVINKLGPEQRPTV